MGTESELQPVDCVKSSHKTAEDTPIVVCEWESFYS